MIGFMVGDEMHTYIEFETITYEDTKLSFPVIFFHHTLWISQKEITCLFEVDKIQLISMLKRVFRSIPKHMHMHDFFIEREQKVCPIRHYDLECILLLQSFYPHPQAQKYILTASSYVKETA